MGLGNPGKQYDRTRHNIGFMAVEALARQLGAAWREDRRWPGRVTKVSGSGSEWHLLLPTTYMNLSGQAVRGYMGYQRIPFAQLLVVVDDIALPFGEMRLKKQGSAGGHNGLKSVQAHLGTADYKRLRLGIGDREHGELSDYVLSKFAGPEMEQLPAFLERAVGVMLELPRMSIDNLMTRVNGSQEPGVQKKKESVRDISRDSPPQTVE